MVTRRGLVASLLVFVNPSLAGAGKKRKKQTIPPVPTGYGVSIHGNPWQGEVEEITQNFHDALSPYAIHVGTGEGIDITSSDQTPPDGRVGEGSGSWFYDQGWILLGQVTTFSPFSSYDHRGKMHLLCHELGHVFGLVHVPVGTDSCMQSNDAGGDPLSFQWRDSPSQSDIATIVALLPTIIPAVPKRHKKRRK